MTTTINNNTVSMNVQDTLPLILRLLDPEELAKYECMTPTTLDYLANYSDAVQPMDYQLDLAMTTRISATTPARSSTRVTRRRRPEDDTSQIWTDGYRRTVVRRVPGHKPSSPATTTCSPTTTTASRAPPTTTSPEAPGNCKSLYVLDPAATATGGKRKPKPSDTTVYVTFKVTEPLLISPFVFGAPEGKQGFYGIQTMNFQMNIAPTANRAWRCANTD
jgi:hypothetical protein